MTQDEQRKCPQCGRDLTGDTAQGLCPACLLRRGLETNTIGRSGAAPAARWTPPTVEQLAPLFPELDILELIGRGGMGAVYKAREKHLDRLVALKILPPEIGREPSLAKNFAQRFAREAQAMAKLTHPNIVTIHSFGQREMGTGTGETAPPEPVPVSLYFFIMEYVDGLSLRQLLDAGTVSPKEALAIVPQICDALQYAHDRGIVHRDIKPENILLNRAGQVKIADFGLAKLVGLTAPGATRAPSPSEGEDGPSGPGEGETPEHTHAHADVTKPGEHILGTPQYMAPEQIDRPGEVDHRADIYSLGVVFYQMLTGELPAGGPGRFEPPSRKVVIDVRLDEVVLRALAHEPARRYQHVSEVKTRVETIVATPGAESPPPPPTPPRPDAASGTESAWQRRAVAYGVAGLLSMATALTVHIFGVAVVVVGPDLFWGHKFQQAHPVFFSVLWPGNMGAAAAVLVYLRFLRRTSMPNWVRSGAFALLLVTWVVILPLLFLNLRHGPLGDAVVLSLVLLLAILAFPLWMGVLMRSVQCGFVEPWDKYGIRLRGTGRTWTIGWCSRCRGIHCQVIARSGATPETFKSRAMCAADVARWLARIGGTFLLALFLLCLAYEPLPQIQEYLWGKELRAIAMLLWLGGWLIGWKWDVWASLLLLSGSAILHHLNTGILLRGILELPTVMGILFLVSWWIRTESPRQAVRLPAVITLFLRVLYAAAVFVAMWPFLGLGMDPGDGGHLARFVLCPLVAAGVAFVGGIISLIASFIVTRMHDGKPPLGRPVVPLAPAKVAVTVALLLGTAHLAGLAVHRATARPDLEEASLSAAQPATQPPTPPAVRNAVSGLLGKWKILNSGVPDDKVEVYFEFMDNGCAVYGGYEITQYREYKSDARYCRYVVEGNKVKMCVKLDDVADGEGDMIMVLTILRLTADTVMFSVDGKVINAVRVAESPGRDPTAQQPLLPIGSPEDAEYPRIAAVVGQFLAALYGNKPETMRQLAVGSVEGWQEQQPGDSSKPPVGKSVELLEKTRTTVGAQYKADTAEMGIGYGVTVDGDSATVILREREDTPRRLILTLRRTGQGWRVLDVEQKAIRFGRVPVDAEPGDIIRDIPIFPGEDSAVTPRISRPSATTGPGP